jgi:hypothetical protein
MPSNEIGDMNTEPSAIEVTRTPLAQQKSAWPTAIACACFFGLTVLLLQAYALLHWKILFHNRELLEKAVRTDLFRLLTFLEVYHATALLAVLFGVWTFRGQPKWLRWVCLPLIILSLLMFIIVM